MISSRTHLCLAIEMFLIDQYHDENFSENQILLLAGFLVNRFDDVRYRCRGFGVAVLLALKPTEMSVCLKCLQPVGNLLNNWHTREIQTLQAAVGSESSSECSGPASPNAFAAEHKNCGMVYPSHSWPPNSLGTL